MKNLERLASGLILFSVCVGAHAQMRDADLILAEFQIVGYLAAASGQAIPQTFETCQRQRALK